MFSLLNARKTTAGLSPRDAVARAAEDRLTLIDVRGHDELARTGKAAGAVHIPLMLLQSQADPRHPEFHPALSAGQPVAVYCASGARSGLAKQMLEGFGFAEVHNIGGLGDWTGAGGPLER